MDDPRIKDIIASGKTCYFISPHYDDMAYSASMFARELAKTNKIVVVNIFTSAGKAPYTKAAEQWTKACGYSDPNLLFAERNREDKNALNSFASEVIDLGFADAPWRKKPGLFTNLLGKIIPEVANIRSSFRFRYYIRKGNAAKADSYNFQLVKRALKATVPTENVEIFYPLGLGMHVDHLMTRQACDELFNNPIYWEDYPYNLKHGSTELETMHQIKYIGNKSSKQKIISAYKTQYTAMFGDTPPEIVPEHFYFGDKQ